ncbi:MAG: hypothetical protein EHM23_05190 [Acidobacteria bacterium]|nr:MAG: hypothetical protein EHM23_05190 [Acidobacteriota bacterium]
MSSRGQELGRKTLDLIKSGANTPANMIRVHNEYVDGIDQMAVRYEGAWREEWSAEYKYLTGLAANLGDPGWHELAVLHIRMKEQNAQTMLLAMVGAAYAPGAYIPSKNLQDLEDSAGQNVPACPESLKRRGLEMDLEIFSVSFSCAEVEVQVGNEGLGAFAKVVYARGGEITIMLGPTAEIGGGFGTVTVEDGLFTSLSTTRV